MAPRTLPDIVCGFPDAFNVKSGQWVVGYFKLNAERHLPNHGRWRWGVTAAVPGHRSEGLADTRDQADTIVRQHFAQWLQWAGLKHRDE